jgi:hypothetical protein
MSLGDPGVEPLAGKGDRVGSGDANDIEAEGSGPAKKIGLGRSRVQKSRSA